MKFTIIIIYVHHQNPIYIHLQLSGVYITDLIKYVLTMRGHQD